MPDDEAPVGRHSASSGAHSAAHADSAGDIDAATERVLEGLRHDASHAPSASAPDSLPTCGRNSTSPETCGRNSTSPETCGRNSTLFVDDDAPAGAPDAPADTPDADADADDTLKFGAHSAGRKGAHSADVTDRLPTDRLPRAGAHSPIVSPDDLTPDDIADLDAASDASFAHGVADIAEVSDAPEGDDDGEYPLNSPSSERFIEMHEEMQAANRRRRLLRVLLAVCIVALVAAAAVLGVLVYNGTLSPNLQGSDTEELSSPAAGSEEVDFEPVDSTSIPQLVSAFGLTIDEVTELYDADLSLAAESTEATDERAADMVEMREGDILDLEGEQIASVGLGLDADGQVVYLYCLFDLDVLAVADATFDELAASDVVAASLLEALGMDESAVGTATLSTDDPGTSADDTLQEVAFQGATGLDAPQSFELVESYDATIGEVTGDNSVMRTALVEFY